MLGRDDGGGASDEATALAGFEADARRLAEYAYERDLGNLSQRDYEVQRAAILGRVRAGETRMMSRLERAAAGLRS